MPENTKKQTLKTISAKIPAETKAALEAKARQMGIIKSDYLRMIIERYDMGGCQTNNDVVIKKPELDDHFYNNLIAQNQLISQRLQDINEKQVMLYKKNKTISNLVVVLIGLVGISCFCYYKN